MHRITVAVAILALTSATAAAADEGATLRGSPSSMVRQHAVAEGNEYSFVRSAGEVEDLVEKGFLVPLDGNEDYEVDDDVSYPVGRPELRLFVERLSAQHRTACGERLVVTSVTRPTSEQPGNSHPLSVHPAGIAVDFRVHPVQECREWMESTLLSLEKDGLLDVTRERRPPHYHVAVYPAEYRVYAERQMAAEAVIAAEQAALAAAEARAALAGATAAEVAPASNEGRRESGPWLTLAALPFLGGAAIVGFIRRRRGDDTTEE